MNEKLNYSQSVFWVDTDRIYPNPYQPRKEFDPQALDSLAQSIRQYGVLQPVVVTRQEVDTDSGGLAVKYELIAGERRLRASRLAGLRQIPALIREKEDNNKAKLEIAIIENLQREDLNPVDRAKAFDQLTKEFNLTHAEVAQKVGKSREYVSNTIRILLLPEDILTAVHEGKITEGHSRPILMLGHKEDEQRKLFDKILSERMTVREAEQHSRRVAQEKVRKPSRIFERDTWALEEELAEKLGTRVRIEKKHDGGKISIDFFSSDDLENILNVFDSGVVQNVLEGDDGTNDTPNNQEEDNSEEDLYSIQNFSI